MDSSSTSKKRHRRDDIEEDDPATTLNKKQNFMSSTSTTTNSLVLQDIPTSEHYQVSYMHRQTVTHSCTSLRHGYVITGSTDGGKI